MLDRQLRQRVGLSSWGLIALGVAVRVAAVLVLQSHTIPHSTYEHGEIAESLLAGRGFSVRFLGAEGPTSQQAPLYPLLVAAAYAVGGVGTPRALLILELGQALLGGLLVASVLALAREIVPGRPRVAWVAGLIAALHPTLIYAATHVQVAALAPWLLTATLASAYRAGRTGRSRDAGITGLWLAALTLTDPILALVAPGVAWAIWRAGGNWGEKAGTMNQRDAPRSRAVFSPGGAIVPSPGREPWEHRDKTSPPPAMGAPKGRQSDPKSRRLPPLRGWNTRERHVLPGREPWARNSRPSGAQEGGPENIAHRVSQGKRRAVRPIALVALVAALGVAPWIVRNAAVHGELVFIKSTFGYAFWQGNCALSEGTDKVVRASVERALERGQGGGLSEWNRALWEARHEAGYLDDIALTPADYRMLGNLSEPARSRHLFRQALDDLRAEPLRYWTLCLRRLRYFVLFDETNPKTRNPLYRASHLGLTLLAVLGLIVARPEARRRLGPTLLTAALIALFHTLTIVSARFHIPIEPLMGLWAASALSRGGGSGSTATADDIQGVGVVRRLRPVAIDGGGRPGVTA